MADVFGIEGSGINDEEFRFALAAHFDFTITDEDLMPLFAVEFDGPTHLTGEQARRDPTKDRLCETFEFPILRINGRYLERKYRGLDLLTWIIETWFMERVIAKAQEEGSLPQDDVFLPSLVISMTGYGNRFPLWLSAEPLQKIRQLHERGKCRSPDPSVIVGKDAAGNYRALSWLVVSESAGVFISTGMRSQRFPMLETEALDEISTFEIFEALQRALRGEERLVALAEIDSAVAEFNAKCKFLSSSICSIPARQSQPNSA